jgi:hypothetical protein
MARPAKRFSALPDFVAAAYLAHHRDAGSFIFRN